MDFLGALYLFQYYIDGVLGGKRRASRRAQATEKEEGHSKAQL